MPEEDEKAQLARLRQMAKTKQTTTSWLWLAVISLGVIIATLWGYSLYNQISTLNFSKSRENELFKAGQQGWDEVFELTKEKDNDKNLVKEKLAIIMQMLKNQSAKSDTVDISPTSTPSTTSTTTLTTTNTIE